MVRISGSRFQFGLFWNIKKTLAILRLLSWNGIIETQCVSLPLISPSCTNMEILYLASWVLNPFGFLSIINSVVMGVLYIQRMWMNLWLFFKLLQSLATGEYLGKVEHVCISLVPQETLREPISNEVCQRCNHMLGPARGKNGEELRETILEVGCGWHGCQLWVEWKDSFKARSVWAFSSS